MTELTYKDISYIRSAIQAKLQSLGAEIEADNDDQLDEPLTEDERQEIQEAIVYYDKLLYMFEKAEKESNDLRVVPNIVLPGRKPPDTGEM